MPLLSSLLLCALASANIATPNLPQPVMARLTADWPGSLLGEAEPLGSAWEVAIKTADGKQLEVLLNATGTVLHFHDEALEVEVAVSDLPEAVRAAVESAWPGSQLLEAESAGTAFEVELRTSAGEHYEALLEADGELLGAGLEDEEEQEEE